MFMTIGVAVMLWLGGQGAAKAPAALPDTPQGRQLAAYLKAFNAGEKAFLAAHDELFAPEFAKKISPERRSEMYKRMAGDFGTLRVDKIVSATPEKIVFVASMQDGTAATFSFGFEDAAPFRITSVDVQVRDRGGV